MKSSKKLVSILLAAAMAVTLLAGCQSKGGPQDSEKTGDSSTTQQLSTAASGGQENQDVYDNGLSKTEKVTIKVIAIHQGYGRAMHDYQAAKFMEMFPNVTVEMTCSPQAAEMIVPRIAANNDADMFDLMFSLTGYTSKLSDEGKVENFNDFLNMPTWDDKDKTMGEDIMPSARELFMYNGKQDRFPFDIATVSYIYNKKMFQENNWNEEPKTWGEFLELCETIKASQKAAPIAFGGSVGYTTWLTNIASMYQGGKDWYDRYIARDKGIYSDPASLDPFKKLKELSDKGYFLKGTEALDHLQSQMEFLQGNAAMLPCGSWIENEMKNSAPPDFEYGTMLQPTNDNPASTRYVEGYCASLWEWANKPDLNKKWVKEYLRFYFSKEVQGICLQSGQISLSGNVMTSATASKLASPFIQNVLKMMSGDVELYLAGQIPAPKVSASLKYRDVNNKIIGDGYLGVVLGKSTPEEIGAAADAAIEEAWKDVGGR